MKIANPISTSHMLSNILFYLIKIELKLIICHSKMAEIARDASPGPKKTVFVVTLGEAYEGGSVQKIFKTATGARKFVEERMAQDIFHKKWKEVSHNHWTRGCDMYDIEEYEVED
jgi:hypothetical protein